MGPMLEFYISLRKDTLVQKLGREERIREIADMINLYTEDANMANYRYGGESHPFNPDADDVQEIAYNVGVQGDFFSRLGKLGDFLRDFFPFNNLLKGWLEKHKAAYLKFRDGADWRVLPDMVPGYSIDRAYRTIEQNERDQKYNEILLEDVLDICQSMALREHTMMGLSNSTENIMKMYSDDKWDSLTRIISGDLSSFHSLNNNSDLNDDRIIELMEYLTTQGAVDGFRARAFHVLYLRSAGVRMTRSAEIVEWTHDLFVNKPELYNDAQKIREQLLKSKDLKMPYL